MEREFEFNDGGREAAGFSGSAGDCVTRAIVIASGLSYKEVYDALAEGNASQRRSKYNKGGKRSARSGIQTDRKWFKDYMVGLGFRWVPTMLVGQGCKVHLCAEELPGGRLVVSLSRHYTAVIDGVIHDTYDPRRDVHYTADENSWGVPKVLPKGGFVRDGMVHWVSRRCVYGYWIFKG